MSIETGRAYLRARGYEDRIQEFSVSSATVELAAQGLLFLLRPVIVASVLPVILGLFIVVDGLVNLKRALELRRMLYLRWTVPLVLSAVSAVLGLVIVFQPFLAAEALVMLIGAVLIYEGLSDLWTIFRVSQWTKEYRKHHPVDVDQIDFE